MEPRRDKIPLEIVTKMLERLKKQVNPYNIAIFFFFAFIIGVFFPIGYKFISIHSFSTGVFSDFTTYSFYLSDIFLAITWFFIFISRDVDKYHVGKPIIILTTWFFIEIILNLSGFYKYSWFFYLRFFELIVAYETARIFLKKQKELAIFIRIFVILATIQAILVVIQFLFQQPVGLTLLGEQQIFPQNKGIAKIVLDGAAYIRGYGTFPHPNPLSAFFLVSILLIYSKLLVGLVRAERFIYSAALFLNTIGLTLTFSRASWLATALGFSVISIFWLKNNGFHKKFGYVLLTMTTCFVLSFLIFKPYILTRTTYQDQAVAERRLYNQIGLRMLADQPIAGLGAGENLLHMERYSPVRLLPWQIQPVHNYLLLAATELGVVGLAALLWLFGGTVVHLWRKLPSHGETLPVTLVAILAGFFVLMQFDHYFYTLQQTQMLLWVILGLAASRASVSRETLAG